MKKFKIGIQLYGVKKTMAEDFEGTLAALAEMGYEYVEFAGYHGRSGEEIKAILDRYGLKCVSVHQSIDFFDEDPQGAVDFLKAFGTKYNIIPWYDKSRLAGSAEWEETKEKFAAAADLLLKNGLMLGYHNHDFEFETYEGKYLHDYILEALGEDRIFPELDTCWVKYAGIDPAAKLRQFAGRVPIVHLKDFTAKRLNDGVAYALIDKDGNEIRPTYEDNGFEYRPLGAGLQNIGEILAACEDSGTEILIVEQDSVYGDMTELEAARLSREYLRNTFGL